MSPIRNLTYHDIFRHPEHCVNQIAQRTLKNGDIPAVFNEERFPFHHDSGQTLMTRSRDGGLTWSEPRIIVPWTATQGNWDCGICELGDGTVIVNFTMTGFFKRGMKAECPSWSSFPLTDEWGDWTWSFKTHAWLGTYVIRSSDGGDTWTEPIPVNVRPMKHGGCRLGAWELPDGGPILALYGRMREYSEDGTGETNRCFLVRSDDGGDNWDYYGTLAYDPNNIIDYEEAGIVRLDDGRLVSFMRTHLQPSQDTKSMIMVVSEDDGFTWSQPKWTRIWGYPPELIRLQDGRYLLVYGYRRPSYGVRGIISDNGIDWDVGNEFVISEGGIPATSHVVKPSSSRVVPAAGIYGEGAVNYFHPGLYQHIGYPTVAQAADGTVVCSYHEWSRDERPLQILKCARFEV